MVGIDIEDHVRFEYLSAKNSFMQGVFTPYERGYIAAKGAHVGRTACGIFCAKEAFAKALGLGILGINFQKCEVRHRENGVPYMVLCPIKYPDIRVDVSISHAKNLTTAICIVENVVKKL